MLQKVLKKHKSESAGHSITLVVNHEAVVICMGYVSDNIIYWERADKHTITPMHLWVQFWLCSVLHQ